MAFPLSLLIDFQSVTPAKIEVIGLLRGEPDSAKFEKASTRNFIGQ